MSEFYIYICIYIYIYICIYIYVYIYICIHMSICKETCIQINATCILYIMYVNKCCKCYIYLFMYSHLWLLSLHDNLSFMLRSVKDNNVFNSVEEGNSISKLMERKQKNSGW